ESAAVDEEFHATYSARLKRYRYVIRIAQADDPFLTRYAWRMSTDLEFEAMRTAAAALLGTHDFRCFESDWPNKATSVQTIFDVSLQTLARWPGWDATPVGLREDQTGSSDSISQGTPEAEFVVFEIEGDGFLYNMVRAIVGTLVKVGRGKWDSSVMSEIIAGQDRSRAGETAPAQGLYLVSVTY
ncbi:MAG: tRNA pseudouridine synthase A, partial [Planctomycetaceae bacterium]|nr:tRNA pseudouridine synthase A [Planctomycetaceae bacterium]